MGPSIGTATDAPPQLLLNAYNLRQRQTAPYNYPIPNSMVWSTAAIALLPLNLGFTSDLNISLQSQVPATKNLYQLKRADVSFTVGTLGDSMLAPFTKTLTTPQSNGLGDWKHRPGKTGTVLPKVKPQLGTNNGR